MCSGLTLSCWVRSQITWGRFTMGAGPVRAKRVRPWLSDIEAQKEWNEWESQWRVNNYQIKTICLIKLWTEYLIASKEELPLAPLFVHAHTGHVHSCYLFQSLTYVCCWQPGAYFSGCSHTQRVMNLCWWRGAEQRFIQCLQESPVGPLWWTLAPRLAAKH